MSRGFRSFNRALLILLTAAPSSAEVIYTERFEDPKFLATFLDLFDGTRDLLLAQPDVHLFLTTDSYAAYGGGMRWLNELLERHGSGTWCLTVDVDELLAYPHAERLGLRGFTTHLDRRGRQALRGFMLDMYAEESLHRVTYNPGDDPPATCRCFDRSGFYSKSLSAPKAAA